ncbi:HalOD1 domain-containing protein [Haloarcula virus HJTV-2]|uniref:HalOD1 domain-containing protein n=1 Tax=Haloarcula virus HJTV-2 TaxID=2877986 RepID=A0AAE8XY13_9CAUD|nr:HalOD1 domain-containing protein [Haloarcula virus HJTV-2]UBF21487.1 HalOD1 domain-containing protein [Halorubrum virus HRTV-24]UBF21621.1 HalOD1 domain-containing protein [Haloarcula virus HJTV-2]UBF21890.1 HalOD1 domain-containing protein [Haloarcula virus HJTV-3]UBF22020.1 HalOD1 domain-containing protein [Halorubrum virus HRTV-15]
MPDPVHSHHVAVDEEHDLLSRGAHDARGPGSLSISVIQELADLLDVDPVTTPLHLEDCIDPDWLDKLPLADTVHGCNNVGVAFHYGDYKVFCCSCGKIAVYGDLEMHERGEMVTPHSMSNITPEKTELELPEHTRKARPDGGRTLDEKPDEFSHEKGEHLLAGAGFTLLQAVTNVPPLI